MWNVYSYCTLREWKIQFGTWNFGNFILSRKDGLITNVGIHVVHLSLLMSLDKCFLLDRWQAQVCYECWGAVVRFMWVSNHFSQRRLSGQTCNLREVQTDVLWPWTGVLSLLSYHIIFFVEKERQAEQTDVQAVSIMSRWPPHQYFYVYHVRGHSLDLNFTTMCSSCLFSRWRSTR